MGFIKNKGKPQRDIQLWMTRLPQIYVARYRQIVWNIFLRILEQTPQGSGRAVANWKIGINSPDMSWDPGAGDDQQFTAEGNLRRGPQLSRGDPKWIDVAMALNKAKLAQIKRGDRVYISNAVRGDTDHGASSEAYLTDLQDPGYWAKKLRAANKPYETAMESAMFVATMYLDEGIDFPLKNAGFSV